MREADLVHDLMTTPFESDVMPFAEQVPVELRTLGALSARIEALYARLIRLRGELLMCETGLAYAHEDASRLQAARRSASRAMQACSERIQDLEQERQSLQARIEHEFRQAQEVEAEIAGVHVRTQQAGNGTPSRGGKESGLAHLRNKAVLCVSPRSATVRVYRQLIEFTGGRFVHYDLAFDGVGESNERGVDRLDASLAAADLVICQSGCPSHGAVWRVRDHCRRTGKPCVLLDKPGALGLVRGLLEVEQDSA